MRKQEHHYEVYEIKNGFIIVPSEEDRPPIVAEIDKYGFWHFKNNSRYNNNIPLYAFYPLLDIAINLLYESWQSPKPNDSVAVTFKITKWAKGITGKTLSKKIHGIWENCANSFSPRVRELHKKLYSVSNGSGHWERVRYILENRAKYKYLINDLLKYRAARIAFMHGDKIDISTGDWSVGVSNIDPDWMKCYAYSGEEKYTSLKKTLMNLPYGVTYYQLFNLQDIRLPEPATTRMRLWAYSILGRNYNLVEEKKNEFAQIIIKSNDEQIKKAIRYIWKYFPESFTGDFRRNVGIVHSLTMIFDYPFELGDWDILGLAKRSEVYHHDLELQERVRQEQLEEQLRINREQEEKEERELSVTLTALPPVPLPDDENVVFLNNYGMIMEEGKTMGHCIASYAKSAVEGKCYLFHVEYAGEMASVEVIPNGYVRQSYGPRDSENKASEYGKKVLGKWAKELINKTPVLRAEIYNEYAGNILNVEMHNNYAALPLAVDEGYLILGEE